MANKNPCAPGWWFFFVIIQMYVCLEVLKFLGSKDEPSKKHICPIFSTFLQERRMVSNPLLISQIKSLRPKSKDLPYCDFFSSSSNQICRTPLGITSGTIAIGFDMSRHLHFSSSSWFLLLPPLVWWFVLILPSSVPPFSASGPLLLIAQRLVLLLKDLYNQR